MWTWLTTDGPWWLTAASVLHLLGLLLIPRVLLGRSASSSGKVAWILAILGVPVLGALTYLIFAAGHDEEYARAKREADADLADLLPDMDREDVSSLPEHLRPPWALAETLSGTPPAGGNTVTICPDPADGFDRLVARIDDAKDSVHLIFYTYRGDRVGTRVRDALVAAARRGVAVRMLYDRFGSLFLSKRFLRPLVDAGADVHAFQPRGSGIADRFRLNLRNHRKIAVIDGRVGFTGGVNVGDEYLDRDPGTAPWRDTFCEVRGPAAGRLQRVFAQDWRYETGQELTDPALYGTGGSADGGEDEGAREDDGQPGDVVLQVLDDGPDRRDRAFESVFAAAIHAARETVDLSTGYFVPTAAVDRALQCAARRGVRVRVASGGPGSPFPTRWAARSFYANLLDAGVQVYERSEGTLHAKVLVVDRHWSLVGSPNCDARSFRLNFEVALISPDRGPAETLARQFRDDLGTCHKIDPDGWGDRGLFRRLGEEFCRLFGPVL